MRSRGFTVDVTYNNPGSIVVTPDFDFSFAALANYDLVIQGRGVSSGDFTDADEWAAVQTPVITFSAYLLRSSRLKLLNSTRAGRAWVDENGSPPVLGSDIPMETVYEATVNNDSPLLTGVDTNGDGVIGYHTWFHDYVGVSRDTFDTTHGGTMLAAWAEPGLNWDGNIAAAYWNAGEETYPGGVTPAGPRGAFVMGADDRSSPKIRNYFAFTDESTLLFHNMIKQMLGFTPDGVEIPLPFNTGDVKIAFLTKDVNEAGSLDELPTITDLRQRGFQVDVTYNNAGSIAVTPDFDFSFDALADYDVVILGRGVSSGDFTDAAAWAAVETPIITFSTYLMRSSRLQLVNSTRAGRAWVDENGSPPVLGTDIDMNTVYNANIASGHPVFTGLDADGDGQIGYHTWFHDFIGYGADTFELNHNATLLASWNEPGLDWDGTLAAAYWEAGVETYPGGVTLAGPRAAFAMGSDDRSSPKVRNYFAFTDESTLAFHNLLRIMLGQEPSNEVFPLDVSAARYSMEGSGDAIIDAVGGANGAIINGNGITRESCGVGNSLNFAGATKLDAMVYVDDSPSLDFDGSSSFSVSAWVKIDPHANTGEMNVLLKGDNRNDGTHLPNGNGHWYSIATKDGELRWAVDDDVTKTQLGVAIDNTSFPADQWNYVVGVLDTEADMLILYLNGNMIGSIANDTDGDMSTTGLPLVIGNYHQGGRRINGGIDEVTIYGTALTAEFIADAFASASIDNDCEVVETIVEISDDATLMDLSVSVGDLTPAFEPTIPNYSVEVPAGTASVDITAVANNPNATVVGVGAFSTLPGTATVSITAEDGVTVREYNISFSVEGQGSARVIVEPGFSTLVDAIAAANAGDTLVLRNGGEYSPIDVYNIGKKIVIVAEDIPALPGLENMPVINNQFGVNPVFQLNFGGDLTLIGIDVNGGGAGNIINCQGDLGVPSTSRITVLRSRLHNTTDDILNDARDGNTDMTTLERCVVKNSFIYDSGGGHGLYVKNYHGLGDFRFENLTIWNLGQQFNWMRHYPEGITQPFLYDHITGYNLSSDLGQDKEIFGNSDNANEAALEIRLKNCILHTQLSNNPGSLIFNNTTGKNDIQTNNNVLFNVAPIADIGGEIRHIGNLEGVDPMFADPDNGDFTVMNAAIYEAADDGEIIGATYWHPDFVDDFSDLISSTEQRIIQEYELAVFPNPTVNEVNVSFNLDQAAAVKIDLLGISGNLAKKINQGVLRAGDHTVNIDMSDLPEGIYLLSFISNGDFITAKVLKSAN
ncbi:MAG: LamG-like jellyroll fold domain-containing protein [Lewinella sp.]